MLITVNLSGIAPSEGEITPIKHADDHSALTICVGVRNSSQLSGEELYEKGGILIDKMCKWVKFDHDNFEIDLDLLKLEYRELAEVSWAKGRVGIKPKIVTHSIHGVEENRSLSLITTWRLALFNFVVDEQTVAESNIVFFSWMSDCPKEYNLTVIEKAAEAAIRDLKQDSELVGLLFDRDTRGTSGAVGIADVIFEKIRKCRAFIADVTIAGNTGHRLTPNPNVMIELGYAVGTIGWSRIIMVCNETYGNVEDLPFDLRGRRTVKYTLRDRSEIPMIKDNLKSSFKNALKDIVR